MAALVVVQNDSAANSESLIGLACRWDCGWYLGLVANGYGAEDPAQSGATNWAFFPLYPGLVWAVSKALGLSPLVAGALLSNGFFLASLGLIYRFTRAVGGDRRAALIAVALVAFLPQGLVFSAVYTESLFVLLLASAMLTFREQRWIAAAASAALLSAVRTNGVFFIVYAAALLWQRFGFSALLQPWRAPVRYLPILAAPLGVFLFWSYAFQQTGDAFAMATTVSEGWGWRWESPLGNLAMHLRSGQVEALFWTLGSLFAFVCSLCLLWRRLFAEFVFCLAVFILIWGGSVPNSLWRYSMVLFPIWVGLALIIRSRLWAQIGLGVLFLGVGAYMSRAWALQELISI